MISYQNPHALGCFWHLPTENMGAPNIKWCEETLCQIISEPANTWSNIGYLIFGLIIIFQGKRSHHSFSLKHLGFIIFFMGLMSGVYHLSNFYPSQLLDFIGMFFFVGQLLGLNLFRLGFITERKILFFNFIQSFLLLTIVHFMYMKGLKFQLLILISVIIILATEIKLYLKHPYPLKWLLLSIAFLSLAFIFSIVDHQRLWCNPQLHGWFSQGHALWHWLSSVAMLTLYQHQTLQFRRQN
jgi:hypothetical protein